MNNKLQILKVLINRYQSQRDELMLSINLLLSMSEYPDDILEKLDFKFQELLVLEDKIQLVNSFTVQIQASNLEFILSKTKENNKEGDKK